MEAADLGLQDAIGDLRKIQAAGKHLLALISDITWIHVEDRGGSGWSFIRKRSMCRE